MTDIGLPSKHPSPFPTRTSKANQICTPDTSTLIYHNNLLIIPFHPSLLLMQTASQPVRQWNWIMFWHNNKANFPRTSEYFRERDDSRIITQGQRSDHYFNWATFTDIQSVDHEIDYAFFELIFLHFMWNQFGRSFFWKLEHCRAKYGIGS